MLSLQAALERVQTSDVYKTWETSHEQGYLSSFFAIVEGDAPKSWQVDFYTPDKDQITSFTLNGETIEMQESSKIFKEKETKVEQLDLTNVKKDLQEAFEIANMVSEEQCKGETITKKIVILQNIKQPLWNLSYITSSFNILNVKIDAEKGTIIDTNKQSAFSFKQAK